MTASTGSGVAVLPDSAEPLTILGASVGAAAESARRAFFAPFLADLFADLDTQALGPTTRIERYPEDFAALLSADHAGGWIYCGALENYPDLIARWSKMRPLFGNGADVLRRVRDPWAVAECLTKANLPCPPLARSAAGLPRDGSWLQKPLRSAAGFSIERLVSGTALPREPVYFQQFIEGISCSAVYMGQGRAAHLIGATRQLHLPGSFLYAGSIGPLELSSEELQQVKAIGTTLTVEFGLVGLFGVDFIRNDTGVWPIEVNPRYTASVEVLERSLGIAALALHVEACRNQRIAVPTLPESFPIVGKQILFAAEDVKIPCDLRNEFPDLADVPVPGSTIPRGAPLLTVLQTGSNCEAVQQQLCATLRDLQIYLTAAAGHNSHGG